MVAALRERSWEGDDVLADQLEAWLGSGVVRDLRPLPVDLGELDGILESDPGWAKNTPLADIPPQSIALPRTPALPRLRRAFAAATAAHRVWPVRQGP